MEIISQEFDPTTYKPPEDFDSFGSHFYHIHTGKHGRIWLTSKTAKNAGDHIYVQGGQNSEGFGGSTLEFKLNSTDTISLKGPWHANSKALLYDTGYDLTGKHAGMYVLALKRESVGTSYIYKDIVYIRPWKVSRFAPELALCHARELAKQENLKIYYYAKSAGGSVHAISVPLKETQNDN